MIFLRASYCEVRDRLFLLFSFVDEKWKKRKNNKLCGYMVFCMIDEILELSLFLIFF